MVGALMYNVAMIFVHCCSYIAHVQGTTLGSKVQGLDFAKNTAAGLKDPENEMQFFQAAKESNTST